MTVCMVAVVPLTIAEIQLLRHHLARCEAAQCGVLKAKLEEALADLEPSRSLTEPRGSGGHGERDDTPPREPPNLHDLSKPYRDTYPYGDTSAAREAYAAHRAELADGVGTEYDPGPWEELSLDVRDIWIAHVKGAK